MATYQEQIAKQEASKTTKAMVSMAELGSLGETLGWLVRDGILNNEERILFLKAYVLKHPEIQERIDRARSMSDGD